MLKRVLLAGCLIAPNVLPASAATAPGTLRGYYGKDYAACGADTDLIRITRRRVQTTQFNCKRSEFEGRDRPGQADTFQVRSTTCIPEGQSKGQSRQFKIEQDKDGNIEISWWDGVSSGRLVKCK